MEDEKMKKIVDEQIIEKSLRKQFKEWGDKAREEKKPICLTCARDDYNKGDLQDYEHYTKGIKEVGRNTSFVKEFKDKESQAKYVLIDYICPRKHGISCHYPYDEFESKPTSKTKE